jgi:hypothetical protein
MHIFVIKINHLIKTIEKDTSVLSKANKAS